MPVLATPLPPGLRLGVIEPRDAIAAFQRRGLLAKSFDWHSVFQEEHARAFAVAGVMQLDVLRLFREELQAALAEGQRFEAFAKSIAPKLAAKGFWGDVEVVDPDSGEVRTTRFDPRRLRLIFDVNLRQSQAAGRWASIERLKARFPFIIYRTMRDERVRASHRPWDGLALPVDDPWWNTHFPPNGWRCRCTAYGIDQRGIDRLRARGETVKTQAPETRWMTYVNPSTAEVVPVPHGVDPGFAYNPGKARDAAFFDAMLAKAARSSPLAAATVVAQAVRGYPAMVRQATEQFALWVDALLAGGHNTGEVRYIGVIVPDALRGLAQAGIEPQSAAIAVRAVDVLHTLRDTKTAADALPVALYRQLPSLLQRASAIVQDVAAKPPALLYVVDLPQSDGAVAKLVLLLDYRSRIRTQDGQRLKVPLNVVRTVTVMQPLALRDARRYRLLWGAL
ncbi:MAG: hypothetical protein HS128_19205 [Ideonella sp.]|nr:hypothetical protein [Ideonella sp.]MCC7455981.1 hypothetical protein [Nitrospira sp.]